MAGATSFRGDFVKQTSHPNRHAFASVVSAWLVWAPYAFYIRACQFDPVLVVAASAAATVKRRSHASRNAFPKMFCRGYCILSLDMN